MPQRPVGFVGHTAHLPISAGTVDIVTCSMALMLVGPVDEVLSEIGHEAGARRRAGAMAAFAIGVPLRRIVPAPADPRARVRNARTS